jgi:hypothetical protein
MSAIKEIKYFLLLRVLTLPIRRLVSLYAKTNRLIVEGDGKVLEHLKTGRILMACWHQRFFGGFYVPNIYGLTPCIMISQSRDGDFIAAVVKKIGWIPVRGSGSRGGKQALIQMVQEINVRKIGVHIVDGPVGPPHIIKPGLISIALKAGAVICPVYISYQNPWIFNSWDKFMVPKPFGKVLIRFGSLISVPSDLTEDDFGKLLSRVEDDMVGGYEEADRYWKTSE